MKEDRQLLVVAHLSQLFGIIIPLILWLTKKDDIKDMDAHGKAIINFQISLIIYAMVTVLLSFFCIGFILIPVLVIYSILVPIINAVNANNGLPPNYYGAIPIIS